MPRRRLFARTASIDGLSVGGNWLTPITSCSRASAVIGKSVASPNQRFTTEARRTQRLEIAAKPHCFLGGLASWRFHFSPPRRQEGFGRPRRKGTSVLSRSS